MSSVMSVLAWSNSTASQDGIKATLSTTQDSYVMGDEVDVILTVENTNSYDAYNISVELFLPAGLSLSSGTALQENMTLSAGESTAVELTATVISVGSSATGDQSRAYLWIVLAVCSFIGLIVVAVKGKKSKQLNLLAVFLAVSIVAVSAPALIAEAATTVKSFTVSHSILLDEVADEI